MQKLSTPQASNLGKRKFDAISDPGKSPDDIRDDSDIHKGSANNSNDTDDHDRAALRQKRGPRRKPGNISTPRTSKRTKSMHAPKTVEKLQQDHISDKPSPTRRRKPARPSSLPDHTPEGIQTIEEKHTEIQKILHKFKHLAS
jgi:hypothetical protein